MPVFNRVPPEQRVCPQCGAMMTTVSHTRVDSFGSYKPTTIERKTDFGFNKANVQFLLEDADGKTWVMKSMGLILDPTQKFEELGALGGRLKLPPGWKFRVAVLDRDLILKPESGVARIVQDDLGSTYELSGPGYSNFTP